MKFGPPAAVGTCPKYLLKHVQKTSGPVLSCNWFVAMSMSRTITGVESSSSGGTLDTLTLLQMLDLDESTGNCLVSTLT